jgi:hypothetical protein
VLRSKLASVLFSVLAPVGLLAVAGSPAQASVCVIKPNDPYLLGGDTVYGSVTLSSCSRNTDQVDVWLERYDLNPARGHKTVGHLTYDATNGQKGVAYRCKGIGTYIYSVAGFIGADEAVSRSVKITC